MSWAGLWTMGQFSPADRLQDGRDTIVVPGALDIEPTLADGRLVRWLAALASKARGTAWVCGGAFLFAEDGLLDGRRIVTHWASCELLHQPYASVTVEPDAIFVQDGPIWTSAGGQTSDGVL